MKNLKNYIDESVEFIPEKTKILPFINEIGEKIERQKGVYTVLVTLSYYKTLYPEQDIRFHQDNMENGFSGRSFDTRHVTPILKNEGFPSMSESGWLTRSLEQPYPYTLDYQGKISDKTVKYCFLKVIDSIESNKVSSEYVLLSLLSWGHEIKRRNHIELVPLDNPETITIKQLIEMLKVFFNKNYQISGGSKLPVICFYSMYQILMNQVKRYENKKLKELGFHTTSDKTSKSSGDIEIFDKDDKLFESLEIKFDIEIDKHIVNIVIDKVLLHNPKRYYILSTKGISLDDYDEIIEKVSELRRDHGCQLIINGIIPTINYYLRLIEDLNEFYLLFSSNVLKDKELKEVHKSSWNEIVEEMIN